MSAPRPPRGGPSGGGKNYLLALLHPWRLSGREWAVVITLWLSGAPMSARQVAKQLRQPYSNIKAVARALLGLGVLQRTREGLGVQPDTSRWALPATPIPTRPSLEKPSKKGLGSTKDREEVFEG